ncbi:uncharacterized protein V1513DRAFT_455570 [Lipomyces chichibuensis]|uniref:uncharacterized protein n=1 Tax=Lipomyces chichibuensis TaxID=1546026 RepID=UPI003343A750
MSTFLGIAKEFPEIRIDYFKEQPGTLPPKACFLSHIHSDYRAGGVLLSCHQKGTGSLTCLCTIGYNELLWMGEPQLGPIQGI